MQTDVTLCTLKVTYCGTDLQLLLQNVYRAQLMIWRQCRTAGNTSENSSMLSVIRMHWLPTCHQQ